MWLIAGKLFKQIFIYFSLEFLKAFFFLTLVTFLAIGYGDLVPNTYCGRAICVVSGLMVN